MKVQPGNISYEVAEGKYDEVWKEINAGAWESRTFRILDYFVGNGDIVLDIGAWIGAISLYSGLLASAVFAIEPDPEVFPELEKNIACNPGLRSKIKCRKLAISTANTLLTLYARNQYGASSSSLLPRVRDRLSSARVQGMTMGKFIEKEGIEKINFIKMDIEGGEFELLPSIEMELAKLSFPSLFVSFHYNYLREHRYHQKIRSRILSRLMMKLEDWSGFEVFGRSNRQKVLNCFESLKNYKFIYNEYGLQIPFNELKANPLLIKTNNLVFTNRRWES